MTLPQEKFPTHCEVEMHIASVPEVHKNLAKAYTSTHFCLFYTLIHKLEAVFIQHSSACSF